jgi:hypothetical protein
MITLVDIHKSNKPEGLDRIHSYDKHSDILINIIFINEIIMMLISISCEWLGVFLLKLIRY